MPAKTRRSLSRSRSRFRGRGASVAPVRIYVLWHPKFEKGLELARHIYAWFRLENMEGIPVFFRTAPGMGMKEPPPIPEDCELNYVLPLVESHMVADSVWRGYVTDLVGRMDVCLYPVALDPFAYRMPVALRHLNFIRHDLDRQPEPSREGLLSQLTEVLCRDLRARESSGSGSTKPGSKTRRPSEGLGQAVPNKIKLFLSHAKADGTVIPVRLKEYIQTQTQCETFFDESDIASGFDYEQILETAIRRESAGMVVVHGDYYAERPWCRREVRRFQQPLSEEFRGSRSANGAAYFVPPLVVVDNMSAEGVARSIPELGYAPCLRWAEGRERIIVSTLLREILLGLFYRRLVRKFPIKGPEFSLLLNRAPDPIRVQQLLNAHRKASTKSRSVDRVLYPGYGLSQLETHGLEETFPTVRFRSLSDALETTPNLEKVAGKVLRLGVGNATDIHAGGLDDEHNKELLIRLLRPLSRNRMSILYGGAMPKRGVRWGTETYRLNFTEVCLNLLLSEQSSLQIAAVSGKAGRVTREAARLYNLAVWPDSEEIKERTIAEWTDVCSFLHVVPETMKLTKPGALPTPDPDLAADLPLTLERRQRLAFFEHKLADVQLERDVTQARCLSYMRQQCCDGFEFPVPDGRSGKPAREWVRPEAHLFLGGRLISSSGAAPGLFEEILYVLEHPKVRKPIFIVGASYGAAGAIARWLRKTPSERPEELLVDHHRRNVQEGGKVCRLDDALNEAAKSAKPKEPPVVTLGSVLDRLWHVVSVTRPKLGLKRLLNNGLSEAENLELLDSNTSYSRICQLVWQGLLKIGS